MKKIIQFLSALSLLFFVGSCSRPTEWSDAQRAEFLAMMNGYRDMIYLRELPQNEFVVFTQDVSSSLEDVYPVYTEFVVMPAVSDTVDMWVVTNIVEDIAADAYNMRHLYPYRSMVAQDILPPDIDRKAQKSFYSCLSQKVNNHFSSINAFFYAVLTSSVEPNIITAMQSECAAELASIEIVEVD